MALVGAGLVPVVLTMFAAAATLDASSSAAQPAAEQQALAAVAPQSARVPPAVGTVPSGLAVPADTTGPPAPHPGMDPAAYADAKAAAARAPATTKPAGF
ncbi:MAG: hypothetical protein ACRDRU_17455 [Pseudonocardiaceae bacterium]